MACPSHPHGKVTVNIHQHVMELEVEPDRHWNEACKQAYRDTAEVIYDRGGHVAQLLREKTRWDDDEARVALIKILGQLSWYVSLNPIRQLDRGLPHHAHDLLNHGVDLIVEAIYLVNHRLCPHRKWRLQEAFHLPRIPESFKSRILEGMLIRHMSAEDVHRRIHLLEGLCRDTETLANEVYELPRDCYGVACQIAYSDRQLRRSLSAYT